jgi:hypothetical protein
MPLRRRHRRDPHDHEPIAVASSCTDCAGHIGNPPEAAPGRHMVIIHAHHIPELVAIGWIVTEVPHEPPDVVCPHYHAAYWQDG